MAKAIACNASPDQSDNDKDPEEGEIQDGPYEDKDGHGAEKHAQDTDRNGLKQHVGQRGQCRSNGIAMSRRPGAKTPTQGIGPMSANTMCIGGKSGSV